MYFLNSLKHFNLMMEWVRGDAPLSPNHDWLFSERGEPADDLTM